MKRTGIRPLSDSTQRLEPSRTPAGAEQAVEGTMTAQPKRRLRLDTSLIRPAGRRIDLSNEEIYELIEFP
jgi:hypothetical protein